MTSREKLEICKATRAYAACSLASSLRVLLAGNSPISETRLRDCWLAELRKNPDIYPEGWYTPPPHGIGVLFATDTYTARVDYMSLRPEEIWPREDIYLDREHGLFYAYCSPVHKKSGIIGDFGASFYLGRDQHIQEHLISCLQMDRQIFEYAQIGMTFSEVNNYTLSLFDKRKLSIKLGSITDPAGTNIGHTVPATCEDWQQEEMDIINNSGDSWQGTCNLISRKRRFVNAIENLKITPGMAFTIEPRPRNQSLPMVSYHCIGVFQSDGTKELLTNFDTLFDLTGMQYMRDK